MESAAHLRARWAGRPEEAAGGHRRLVLAGGRPGVGATTLCRGVGLALAREGWRVVLFDADLARGDLTASCRVQPRAGLAEVLSGRRSVHETLVLGPAGTQLLPTLASSAARDGLEGRALQRLVRQLDELRPHVDWLVIDAGNQPSELAAHLWAMADQLLVVTSPDPAAVMDTYALVRTLGAPVGSPPRLGLVVNQAASGHEGVDVHRRIDRSCRRFLGWPVDLAATIPYDPQAQGLSAADRAAAAAPSPLVEGVAALVRLLADPPDVAGGRHRPAA